MVHMPSSAIAAPAPATSTPANAKQNICFIAISLWRKGLDAALRSASEYEIGVTAQQRYPWHREPSYRRVGQRVRKRAVGSVHVARCHMGVNQYHVFRDDQPFDVITRIGPGIESAEQRTNPTIALHHQALCGRSGRYFVWAAAIDDHVLIDRHIIEIPIDAA